MISDDDQTTDPEIWRAANRHLLPSLILVGLECSCLQDSLTFAGRVCVEKESNEFPVLEFNEDVCFSDCRKEREVETLG